MKCFIWQLWKIWQNLTHVKIGCWNISSIPFCQNKGNDFKNLKFHPNSDTSESPNSASNNNTNALFKSAPDTRQFFFARANF